MSRFNGKTFSRTPSASSRADAEPPQSFDDFKAMRTKSGGGDPHALAKVRIKSQIESAYAQKRMERLSHLSFFVERAFDLAVSTGEVVIGRDRDELADDGMKHVTNSLKTSTGKFITSLNVPSHHIGKAGATQLAQALQAAPKLVTFNIANNMIGSEGADVLAKCFTSVPSLENLDLSENRIGPAFPPNLVLCTSLKKLDIRHNKLTEIPCALGMHPKLALLDLAYNNLRMIPDSLVRAGCVPILRELVDQAMHQACLFGQHNQDLQPITGVRPDQKVTPGAQNYCYPLEDLVIMVNNRWNQDTDWLAGLLEKHTTLRGINDLHEWPVPPTAVQTTWDLDGRLSNPLYECVFVRNCLMRSPLITSINISNNDLRGRCAICLAQAIESSRTIVSIDVNNCM
jgi:Leucine-rich repeat (LRR) protein